MRSSAKVVNVPVYKQKSGFCPIACLIRNTDSNQVDSQSVFIFDYAKGNYQDAITQHQRSLSLSRRVGNRYREALALNHLGKVHLTLDQNAIATDFFNQALSIYRELGDRLGEANVVKILSRMSR